MSSKKRRAFLKEKLNKTALGELPLKERTLYYHAELLHEKLFREEYNCMYDSYADSRDRASGKNPMNDDYIFRIARKRAKLDVSPLDESGMPTDQSSMQLCIAEQRALMAGKTTAYTEIIKDILIY